MKKETLTRAYTMRLNRDLLTKVEVKINPTELRKIIKKKITNYLKKQL